MDGSIPSAVADTPATSNVGKFGCGHKLTGNASTKIFSTATGQKVYATETGIMEHELREPARTFDMVPDITLDPFASTRKMCDAGYFFPYLTRRRSASTTQEQRRLRPPILSSSKGDETRSPPSGASR